MSGVELRRGAGTRSTRWTASSTASNLSPQPSSASSPSTFSSPSCSAICSAPRSPIRTISAGSARHPYLLGHCRDQLSRRPYHRRPRLGRGKSAGETRNRRLRDARAPVRGHRSDRDAVRQGAATRADHVLTYDLHLPTWPFFAVAWAGDVSAVILIAVRTYRLIFHPEKLAPIRSPRRWNEARR